ncbi:MAG: SGNH/GDSL hydrolase family protein [Opitutaceae bacterium]
MKQFLSIILTLSLCAGSLNGARMVVFGDSLSDSGYYVGIRFTDTGGDLWHEYLADRLGYERARVRNFLYPNRLNFAISASRVSDLQDQVYRYEDSRPWQAGDLCALWIGGNDLRDNPTQNMTLLAQEVGDIIAQLAALGVDHFIVPNLPDLGAIPETQGNPTLMAQRRAGTIAFNNALSAELVSRAASLSITIEQLDIFSLFDHMLFYAGDFGYTNTTDPLADASNAEPSEYVFWDGIHPTTRSHSLISSAAVALIDEMAPIEIVSASIESDLSYRQTWIAAPEATYHIQSSANIQTLTNTTTHSGSPAYTSVVASPGPQSGFFKTVKD